MHTINRILSGSPWVVVAFIGCMFGTGPALALNVARPPDPCDKELSINDVQGILTGKAAITHYSMTEPDPGEGCTLGVRGSGWASIDISIQQGGSPTFRSLISLAPPARTPVAGIGDEAFRSSTTNSNMPNAKETNLFARKGSLICTVQLHRSNGDGEKLVVPATDDAIAVKLGALCKKLFAARGGS